LNNIFSNKNLLTHCQNLYSDFTNHMNEQSKFYYTNKEFMRLI